MDDFLERVRAGLTARGVAGGPLLVAVSGGADSVALLRATAALRGPMGLTLQTAHLNHNLRGAESHADVRWLETLCERLAVPLVVGSEEIASLAAAQGKGIEETARQQRYAFLRRTAVRLRCSHVAVAHTADDQAETVLHHVLRGTGLAGLRGIPSSRPLGDGITLVRPLLEIDRSDIGEWLAELGQAYRQDVTNLDPAHTRNRIRHSLLPMLERDYNPQVREALRRLARQAEDMQQALEVLVRRLLGQALEERSDTLCRLNCGVLADQPRHLVRECFAQLWKEQNWPRQRMGFREWDRLADLVHTPGAVTLPENIDARRQGADLVLRR